jgi:hypothetical protein
VKAETANRDGVALIAGGQFLSALGIGWRPVSIDANGKISCQSRRMYSRLVAFIAITVLFPGAAHSATPDGACVLGAVTGGDTTALLGQSVQVSRQRLMSAERLYSAGIR